MQTDLRPGRTGGAARSRPLLPAVVWAEWGEAQRLGREGQSQFAGPSVGEESGAETTCFWRPDLHLETTPASPPRASAGRAQAGPAAVLAAGPQFPHPPGRGEDSRLLGLSPPSGVVIYEGAAAAAAASRFSRVRLCANPQTAAHQALPSLGFSRQEHWSGLPFPSPVHESEK